METATQHCALGNRWQESDDDDNEEEEEVRRVMVFRVPLLTTTVKVPSTNLRRRNWLKPYENDNCR